MPRSILHALLALSILAASVSSHLPAPVDRSRIRSLHRRQLSRRLPADCDERTGAGAGAVLEAGAPLGTALGLLVPDGSPVEPVSASRVSVSVGSSSASSAPVPGRLYAGYTASDSNAGVNPRAGAPALALNETVKLYAAAAPAPESGSGSGAGADNAVVQAKDGVVAIKTNVDYAVQAVKGTTEGVASQQAGQALPSSATKGQDLAVDEAESVQVPGHANVLAAAPASASQASCNHGDWRCTGMNLERCVWNVWTLIRTCTGDNIVCSSAPSTTGCVWTWSVQQSSSAPSAPSVSPLPNAGNGAIPSGTTRPSAVSQATRPTSSASTPAPSQWPAEEDDECEEWEDEPVSTTSRVAAVAPSASSSVEEDEECEEYEEDETAPSGASSVASSKSTIGNGFNATPTVAPTGLARPSNASSVASSSSSRNSTTSSARAVNSTVLPSNVQVTASASGSILSNLTNPSKTLSIINASTISIPTTASVASSATSGVVTGTPSGIATYSAPHYVIYSDLWLHSMPSVSDLASFNRFILAFWLSDQGPVDNALMWVWMSAADRKRVLDSYHAAGIALMVSAFGSTDQPTTMGKDPLTTAQDLAKYVIAYGFDGVDIDYEDMGAMNSNKGEAWLIPFQRELRRLLPAPYIISHAPVAPWFTSAAVYQSGAYVAVHQRVGDGIDFYNVQFYNQGDGVYTDCTGLITQSGGYWPGTSVMELNSYAGVPLNKVVIGKPLDAGKATNGYMDPAALNTCVRQARGLGWNGGVMFWEWTAIMATARA